MNSKQVAMRCPECGYQDTGNYCSDCGHPLTTADGTAGYVKQFYKITLLDDWVSFWRTLVAVVFQPVRFFSGYFSTQSDFVSKNGYLGPKKFFTYSIAIEVLCLFLLEQLSGVKSIPFLDWPLVGEIIFSFSKFLTFFLWASVLHLLVIRLLSPRNGRPHVSRNLKSAIIGMIYAQGILFLVWPFMRWFNYVFVFNPEGSVQYIPIDVPLVLLLASQVAVVLHMFVALVHIPITLRYSHNVQAGKVVLLSLVSLLMWSTVVWSKLLGVS